MAATVTGQNASSTADPHTQSLTVPAGCTTCVVAIAYYPDLTISSPTLGGVAPDYSLVVPNGDSIAMFVWNDPPTGSQTLSIDYSGALGAGSTGFAFYIEGAEPFGGASFKDYDVGPSTGLSLSATISGIAADWLVIRFQDQYSPAADPTLESGWTNLGVTGDVGQLWGRASYKYATGTSITATTPSVDYPTLQIFAFEPLAGGADTLMGQAML